MDRLIAMQVFTKVVEMNGFSKAADALGLPRGAPTTIIKNLEAHLHVQLMQRTTRHLKLTPKGAEYYERCVKILAEVDDVEHSIADNGKGARGRLRVDMPASLGRLVVMPQIEKFRERFANIDLVVGFRDKLVDLVKDSVDCAI
jgi:LysR family transcriptional regulator, regulator for bpeEF and oprC